MNSKKRCPFGTLNDDDYNDPMDEDGSPFKTNTSNTTMENKVELDPANSRLELRYKTYDSGNIYKYHITSFAQARRITHSIKKEYPKASFSLIRIWEEKIENWE